MRTVESIGFGDKSPATVACWLVDCPVSHPVWNQYFLSLIMLREVEGVKPATIKLEGATHEIMIFAIDPRHPQTKESMDEKMAAPAPVPVLFPPNICQQFKAEHDADAMSKIEHLLKTIISLDSDFRSRWVYELTGEIE